jgi:magnesium-transporting ATPase (P-type)
MSVNPATLGVSIIFIVILSNLITDLQLDHQDIRAHGYSNAAAYYSSSFSILLSVILITVYPWPWFFVGTYIALNYLLWKYVLQAMESTWWSVFLFLFIQYLAYLIWTQYRHAARLQVFRDSVRDPANSYYTALRLIRTCCYLIFLLVMLYHLFQWLELGFQHLITTLSAFGRKMNGGEEYKSYAYNNNIG